MSIAFPNQGGISKAEFGGSATARRKFRETISKGGTAHVEPNREAASADLCRAQDAAAKAGTAGVEPLLPVDGLEPGLRGHRR